MPHPSQACPRDCCKLCCRKPLGFYVGQANTHFTVLREGATEALKAGLSVSEVQTLGRWKSSSMVGLYNRPTKENFSEMLDIMFEQDDN